jgi:hypothetical protein
LLIAFGWYFPVHWSISNREGDVMIGTSTAPDIYVPSQESSLDLNITQTVCSVILSNEFTTMPRPDWMNKSSCSVEVESLGEEYEYKEGDKGNLSVDGKSWFECLNFGATVESIRTLNAYYYTDGSDEKKPRVPFPKPLSYGPRHTFQMTGRFVNGFCATVMVPGNGRELWFPLQEIQARK